MALRQAKHHNLGDQRAFLQVSRIPKVFKSAMIVASFKHFKTNLNFYWTSKQIVAEAAQHVQCNRLWCKTASTLRTYVNCRMHCHVVKEKTPRTGQMPSKQQIHRSIHRRKAERRNNQAILALLCAHVHNLWVFGWLTSQLNCALLSDTRQSVGCCSFGASALT